MRYSFGSGSNNPSWRGNDVGYHGRHKRMYKTIPKPNLCQRCNSSPPAELHNISGEYRLDVNDWEYLCVRCHMMTDGRIERNLKHGFPQPEESKEKNRLAHLGKRASLETRLKMSQSHSGKNNAFYGRSHTKETKEKLRQANTGRHFKHTEATKEKIRLSRIGKRYK